MGHEPMILRLFPDLALDDTALALIAAAVVGTGIVLLFVLAPERGRKHRSRKR